MLQFVATKFQKIVPEKTVAAGNTVLCAEHGVKMWSLSLSCHTQKMLDSSPESKIF